MEGWKDLLSFRIERHFQLMMRGNGNNASEENREHFLDRLGEPTRQVAQEGRVTRSNYVSIPIDRVNGSVDEEVSMPDMMPEILAIQQSQSVLENDSNLITRSASPMTYSELSVEFEQAATEILYDTVETLPMKMPRVPFSLSIDASKLPREEEEENDDDNDAIHKNFNNGRGESWRYSSSHTPVGMSSVLHPFERHNTKDLMKKALSEFVPSKTFTAQFDFVIVFPVVKHAPKGQSHIARYVMHTMLNAGLELFPFLSVQDDEIVVLIRCPVRLLHLVPPVALC